MDCSLPGFSVHEISQASILEWVAISFSRGSSWPRDWIQISMARRFFTAELPVPDAAAAVAKSLQLCPTLCYPIDDRSPPGSPVPGILQARTLEWVAISFSNAWKWKVKGKSLSRVWLLATPWTAAYQTPPSVGFSRQEYWSGCHCLLRSYLSQLVPNRCRSLSQEIEATWMSEADNNIFYLVLELFMFGLMKNHLSVRTDKTLEHILKWQSFLWRLLSAVNFMSWGFGINFSLEAVNGGFYLRMFPSGLWFYVLLFMRANNQLSPLSTPSLFVIHSNNDASERLL